MNYTNAGEEPLRTKVRACVKRVVRGILRSRIWFEGSETQAEEWGRAQEREEKGGWYCLKIMTEVIDDVVVEPSCQAPSHVAVDN